MSLPDQTTLNTLMYFSVLAYSSNVPGTITPFVEAPNGQQGSWPSWTALHGHDLDTPSIPTHLFFGDNNFFKLGNAQAIVAINEPSDALILAFKGTDLKSITDWVENLFYINLYYDEFALLLQSIDHYLSQNANITKVYVTGDSLGAAAAEQYMYNHADTSSVSFTSVTFGSPGFALDGRPATLDDRVLDIRHAGDPVPWLGHKGKGYSSIGIELPITLFDFKDGAIPLDISEHFKGLYQLNLFDLSNSALYRFADTNDTIVMGVGPGSTPPDVVPPGSRWNPGTGLSGRSYNDTINETPSDSPFFLLGLAGDDDLTGGTQRNLLDGGPGNDRLQGGPGDDYLAGGLNNDQLFGRSGNDTYVFVSGDGADTIDELDLGGEDVLEIHASLLRNIGLAEISYGLSGGKRDLTVELAHGAQGSITIKHMDTLLSRVETLRAFNVDGHQNGPDVDLVQEYNALLNDAATSPTETLVGGLGDEHLDGGAGNDRIFPSETTEFISLGGGADAVIASLSDLVGDRIADLSPEDRIVVVGSALARSDLHILDDGQTLGVTRDGIDLGSLSLTSGLQGGDLMVARLGSDSVITFQNHLPELVDGARVSAGAITGIVNRAYLNGDTSPSFDITIGANAGAFFRNSLGTYEVDAFGAISNVQIVAPDVRNVAGPLNVSGVDPGHELGFFIVQDGANRLASSVWGSDGLSIVPQNGALALRNDGVPLPGILTFFSHDPAANVDGMEHTLSGVAADGSGSIWVGFEDLLRNTGQSDDDFQDVVVSIHALGWLL